MATMATGTEPQETNATENPNPLKQYTAMMPADELKALDDAAAADHVSRSFAIREGAKLWLKARAKR